MEVDEASSSTALVKSDKKRFEVRYIYILYIIYIYIIYIYIII